MTVIRLILLSCTWIHHSNILLLFFFLHFFSIGSRAVDIGKICEITEESKIALKSQVFFSNEIPISFRVDNTSMNLLFTIIMLKRNVCSILPSLGFVFFMLCRLKIQKWLFVTFVQLTCWKKHTEKLTRSRLSLPMMSRTLTFLIQTSPIFLEEVDEWPLMRGTIPFPSHIYIYSLHFFSLLFPFRRPICVGHFIPPTTLVFLSLSLFLPLSLSLFERKENDRLKMDAFPFQF